MRFTTSGRSCSTRARRASSGGARLCWTFMPCPSPTSHYHRRRRFPTSPGCRLTRGLPRVLRPRTLCGGFPLARIAVAQVLQPELPERGQRQRPAKRREVQDVGDDPAVGERFRRVAGGVNEGDFLPAPSSVLELADECRTRLCEPLPH